ncbi:hypothetical protein P3L10_030117 [Capsicum annuum]
MDREFTGVSFISWLFQAGRQFILGFFTLVLTGAIEATSTAVLQHLLGDLHIPLCTEMDELRTRIRSCSVNLWLVSYCSLGDHVKRCSRMKWQI